LVKASQTVYWLPHLACMWIRCANIFVMHIEKLHLTSSDHVRRICPILLMGEVAPVKNNPLRLTFERVFSCVKIQANVGTTGDGEITAEPFCAPIRCVLTTHCAAWWSPQPLWITSFRTVAMTRCFGM